MLDLLISKSVTNQFVQLSLQFLEHGSNPKMYNSAARALDVSVEKIADVVAAIAHLLSEAARFKLTAQQFTDSVNLVLELPEATTSNLEQLFVENCPKIRSLQSSKSFQLPEYREFSWRLDVEIGSRTLRNQIQPIFVTKWGVEREKGRIEKQILQVDVTNVKHLAAELEGALNEMRNSHVRRVMRNIK